jgi:hypothetical protein
MAVSERLHPAEVNGPRRLVWLTALGGPAVVAGGVYAVTGHGLPCPFLTVTGWLCPLCGGSRMGAALLAGDLPGGWGWNPFALVAMACLGLVWMWTAVRVVTRRPAGLPGLLARLDQLRPTTMLWLILVPAVIFAALRNAV